MWFIGMDIDTVWILSSHIFTGEAVVRQGGPSIDRQRPSSHRSATPTRRTTSEPLCQNVLPA